MRKTIELTCAHCQRPFEKDLYEYRRWLKRGRLRFYCGLSCQAKQSNRETPRKGCATHLTPSNRQDAYSPFRWFLRNVHAREMRKGPTDLTLTYLKELWDAQQGICPFTGWTLTLPLNVRGWADGLRPNSASLDRVDAARGYVQGNVRFVAVMANYARNSFADSDLQDFCTAVYMHNMNQVFG